MMYRWKQFREKVSQLWTLARDFGVGQWRRSTPEPEHREPERVWEAPRGMFQRYVESTRMK